MNKFKRGDIVTGTEAADEAYRITGKGWTGRVVEVLGETLKLSNADGTFKPKVMADYFRLATEEEKRKAGFDKAKFHKGDWVVGNEGADVYGKTKCGWVGIVVDVRKDENDEESIKVKGPGFADYGVWVLSARFDRFNIEGSTCPADLSSGIKDVIFNAPATIVFWNDGTKTVVKCGEGEKYDPEKGLALCIAKKALGNNYGYYEPFKKYLGKYHKKESKKASAKKTVAPKTKTKKPVAKKPVAKKTVTRKSTSKK